MSRYNVLFEGSNPKALDKVREKIREFEYTDASCDTIRDSLKLKKGEETFITCSTRILSNFGMTRGGPPILMNQTYCIDVGSLLEIGY